MSKKIMMLALAAVSAAMFALPATASANLDPISLHMSPTPAKLDIAGVGHATLRSSSGNITCTGLTGSATPAAGGTTGTMTLTFSGCTGPGGGTCTGSNPAHPSGSILTTVLPYHLVTLKNNTSPGVLVTPGTGDNKSFAHFNCIVLGFPVQTTVEGNGVLGTITAPPCNTASSTSTISFKAVAGSTTQEHTEIKGSTPGPYSLSKGGNAASQEAHATLTATNSEGKVTSSTLVCT